MSHEHNEIIMPPTTDVDKAIAEIMAPFCEHASEDDEHDPRGAFWDFYVIGGRFAGSKTEAALDPEALKAFNAWMTAEKVMVKGLVFGKQELADRTTVEMVDAKWREMFPGAGPRCTLFKHSNTGDEPLPGDVCRFADIPERATAWRVLIAAPDHEGKKLEAVYMVSQRAWNGVTHIKTEWDGTVHGALKMFAEHAKHYAPAYAERITPRADWLAVTVDTHT